MLRKTLLLAMLATSLLLTTGCSDDDTTSPPATARINVVINVVDTNGNPVPNLDLSMCNDHQFLQKAQGPDKAVSKFEYYIFQPGLVTLTIADIEGNLVRSLYSEWVTFPGWRKWEGLDNDGVHQMSGRYTVLLTLHDESDELVDSATTDILMSLARLHPVGTTDGNGQLVLTDRKLFPHLYGKEPMQALDENANSMGLIDLDETMYFRFYNADRSQYYVDRQPVLGSGELNFVWDPVITVKAQAAQAPQKNVGLTPPPYPEVLVIAYPNPFN